MCLYFVSPARFPVKAGDQTVSSISLVFSIILVVRGAGAWEMAYNVCSLGKKERQSQNVGLLCLPIPSSACDKASFNSWVKKDSQDEFGLKTGISCAKGTKICGINVLFGPWKSQTLNTIMWVGHFSFLSSPGWPWPSLLPALSSEVKKSQVCTTVPTFCSAGLQPRLPNVVGNHQLSRMPRSICVFFSFF